jgi:hypothetical protein
VAKKNMSGKKPSGAASIAVVEDLPESTSTPEPVLRPAPVAETPPAKVKEKAKDDQSSGGNFGIGEIRKAAAFANSVGGLDKAIALLQILKGGQGSSVNSCRELLPAALARGRLFSSTEEFPRG